MGSGPCVVVIVDCSNSLDLSRGGHGLRYLVGVMNEITTDAATASAIAASVSAFCALLSLSFAVAVHRRASQGKAVVTWRLREPGIPVIDVLVKNTGAVPLYNLAVHVPRLENPIGVPVLSPGDETIIDTLSARDDEQTYRVTRSSWLSMRCQETSAAIDPKSLTGIKLGGQLPLTRIATILERLEKTMGDVPVLRDEIDPIGISRMGEAEWLLPPGVRGVLLPSATRRRGLHRDTALGDTHVRRKANDEVVHQPQQTLRIVMDETVSQEERARIRDYLDLGNAVTLHWHRGPSVARLSYVVLNDEFLLEKPATVLERGVRYVERNEPAEDTG